MEKLASGWRRRIQVTTPAVAAAAAAALAISLSACSSPVTTAKTLQATNSPSQSPQASAIAAIVRKGMTTFTYKERLGYAFRRPVQFPPGKNWSYAHTNFMILGHILSMIGKKPLATLLRQKVLKPRPSAPASSCPGRATTP